MFICQCPPEYCSGKLVATSNGLSTMRRKVHGTGVEANRCYAKYLVKVQGYQRIEFQSRSIRKPGQPVLILPKRRRPDMKRGKPGKAGVSGSRYMPKRRSGGVIT